MAGPISWEDLAEAVIATPLLSGMDLVEAAVTCGDLCRLKKIETARGVDLRQLTSSKGSRGRNLLHLAVMGARATGWLDVCRYLVEEKGFDPKYTSAEGETTIFVATESAAAAGVVPLLTYFLGHGVDPAAPDARGFTPLHNAAGYGDNEAIVLLLSKGIPVDPLNYNGTPLHFAAKKGHAQAVKILLEHGADPNIIANRVYSPLVMACLGCSLECVKLLVEAGADVNFHPPRMTMLLPAVGAGSASVDIVNFLLEAGANPNVHDGFGRFPIIQAAVHGRRELVEILLPRTNPISYLPDWSVDGIISTMKTLRRELFVEPIANAKLEGKEAFANGDYGYALFCYSRARCIDPEDETIEANLSLCFLKMREGKLALEHAKNCQRLSPRWAKAWFREGEALSLLEEILWHGEETTLRRGFDGI